MNKFNVVTTVFLVVVGLAFLNVGVQAFINPQSVMDFVSVHLDNINARNSTRAFYGGVNLSFALFFLYGAFKMKREALLIALLYGGGFVLGRVYSIIAEGVPGPFILTWLCIETFLTIVSGMLLLKWSKGTR